jgi:hypothetical protein
VTTTDDGIEHARRLLRSSTGRGPYPTEAETELHETFVAVPDEPTLTSPVPGAPTLPVEGVTDHEVGAHASKITAAVEVLIRVVEQLRDEIRSRALAMTQLDAEYRDLRDRHHRLVETVQEHSGRITELEAVVDTIATELPHHRALLKVLVAGMAFTVVAGGLALALLVVLVLR